MLALYIASLCFYLLKCFIGHFNNNNNDDVDNDVYDDAWHDDGWGENINLETRFISSLNDFLFYALSIPGTGGSRTRQIATKRLSKKRRSGQFDSEDWGREHLLVLT